MGIVYMMYSDDVQKDIRIRVFDGIIRVTRNRAVIYQADRHRTRHKREGGLIFFWCLRLLARTRRHLCPSDQGRHDELNKVYMT